MKSAERQRMSSYNQSRMNSGTQSLSNQKYKDMLIANGMKPDEGEESSSYSNMLSGRSKADPLTPYGYENFRIGDASNDSEHLTQTNRISTLAESQKNYNKENLRILQQQASDRDRYNVKIDPQMHSIESAPNEAQKQLSNPFQNGPSHQIKNITTPDMSQSSGSISNAHLSNLKLLKSKKGEKTSNKDGGSTSSYQPSNQRFISPRNQNQGREGDQSQSVQLTQRSSKYKQTTEQTPRGEIEGNMETLSRNDKVIMAILDNNTCPSARRIIDKGPHKPPRPQLSQNLINYGNQNQEKSELNKINIKMQRYNNYNQNQNQILDLKREQVTTPPLQHITNSDHTMDDLEKTKNSKKSAKNTGSYMLPTSSSKQKSSAEMQQKSPRKDSSAKRLSNMRADKSSTSLKTSSKFKDDKYDIEVSPAEIDTPDVRGAQDNSPYGAGFTAITDVPNTQMYLEGSNDNQMGNKRTGSVRKTASNLSNNKSEDSLRAYGQKEPTMEKKASTKVIKGGPQNMNNRINQRRSRSREPQTKKDSYKSQPDQGNRKMTGQSPKQKNQSPKQHQQSNIYSVQSKNTKKPYGERKVGISGLKPYASDKAVAPVEESKPNQVNIVLQNMHVMRDLNRIKGISDDDEASPDIQQALSNQSSEEEELTQEQIASLSDDYLLDKDQMMQLLFQINYLPFLKNQSKYNVDSKIYVEGQKINKGSNFKEEIQNAQILLEQFWNLMNFQNKTHIRRYSFYKFMKLLMLNINKCTDHEMHNRIALYFIKRYEKNNIQLRQRVPSRSSQLQAKSNLNLQDFQAIEEESETKTRQIFNAYQNSGKDQYGNKYEDGSKQLTDVKLVNRHHQSENPACFTIQKFYKAFKHDHAQRFAYIQHEEATMKSTKIMLSPRLHLDKQSHETLNMIPIDGRKYKEHTIKHVIDQHTFKPKIKEYNAQYANRHYERLKDRMQGFKSVDKLDKVRIFEQGAESSRGRKDNDFDAIDKHDNGALNLPFDSQKPRNSSNANFTDFEETSKSRMNDPRKTDFMRKYELLLYQKEMKVQERERQKHELEQEALKSENCTFKPQINTTYERQRVKSPTHENFWQRTLRNRPYDEEKIEPKTNQFTQFAWNTREQKRLEEEAELTFQPNTLKAGMRSMSQLSGRKIKRGASEFDEGKPLSSIKGFDKTVARLKDNQREKEQAKKKQEQISRGDNYQKVRVMDIKPPSFILSPRKKRERKVFSPEPQRPQPKVGKIIFNAHISITPTRTESLIMREGENPATVAEIFARKFNLGEPAKQTLIGQLELNIKLKKEKRIQSRLDGPGTKNQPQKAPNRDLSPGQEDVQNQNYSTREQLNKYNKSNEDDRQKYASPQHDSKRNEPFAKQSVSSGKWSSVKSQNNYPKPMNQQYNAVRQSQPNPPQKNYNINQPPSELNNSNSISNYRSVPGTKSLDATGKQSKDRGNTKYDRVLSQKKDKANVKNNDSSINDQSLKDVSPLDQSVSRGNSKPKYLDTHPSPRKINKRLAANQSRSPLNNKHMTDISSSMIKFQQPEESMDNTQQNTDLISLIKTDNDGVNISQINKKNELNYKAEQDLQMMRIDSEDDEDEQPPEESQDDEEKLRTETLNRSFKKSGIEELDDNMLNNSAIKWSNQQSEVEAPKYHSNDNQLDSVNILVENREQSAAAYQSVNVRNTTSKTKTSARGKKTTTTTLKTTKAINDQSSLKDYQRGQDLFTMVDEERVLQMPSQESPQKSSVTKKSARVATKKTTTTETVSVKRTQKRIVKQ